MAHCLVVVPAILDEIQVAAWDDRLQVSGPNVRATAVAIGREGVHPTELGPEQQVRLSSFQRAEQHLLVVAQQRDDGAAWLRSIPCSRTPRLSGPRLM